MIRQQQTHIVTGNGKSEAPARPGDAPRLRMTFKA
jgi:hypothetical protein